MTKDAPSQWNLSRRAFAAGASSLLMQLGALPRMYAAEGETLDRRFDHLSKNGNSTCSPTFTESISTMPVTGRLKGSCCSPMDRHRYGEQIEALKKYSAIEAIPPDPYDIAAGAAQKAMSYYDLVLSADEEKAYQYAMANSDEKGRAAANAGAGKSMAGSASCSSASTGSPASNSWRSGICRAAAAAGPSIIMDRRSTIELNAEALPD